MKDQQRAKLPHNRLLPRPGKKNRGNPNPLPPPVEHRFRPGQSANPGGRPKLLSDAYRAQLAKLVPNDPENRTYAEAIASGRINAAIDDTGAAREVRSATEGERIRTWRDDVIDLLRAGTLTPEQVQQELGDDIATELVAASGIRRSKGGETSAPSETDNASEAA